MSSSEQCQARSFRDFHYGTDTVTMVDWNYPKTVEEAVARLKGELSLKDRVYIANLTQESLYLLHLSLKAYVGQELGLLAGNTELIESCRIVSHSKELNPEHCLAVILKALWEDLRETHVLRVVGSEE